MTAELLGFDLPPRGPVALAASIAAWRRGTPHPLPDQPLSDADWNPFFAVVARNRLTGLLTDAVASGAFPLTSTQRRALTRVHNFMILRVMHLERAALELVAELNELGIEHRLLKGAALARTVHADPDLGPKCSVRRRHRGFRGW